MPNGLTYINTIPDYLGDYCIDIRNADGTSQRSSSALDKAEKFISPAKEGSRFNVAFFGDHTSAYYYWHLSKRERELKDGAVLVHIDTHNDMSSWFQEETNLETLAIVPLPPPASSGLNKFKEYTNDKLGISDFIAAALVDGLVSEIYWVLPDWAQPNSRPGEFYWGQNPLVAKIIVASPSRDFTLYACAVKISDEVCGYLTPQKTECEGEIKTIPVHKIYKEELPDFKAEKRSVIVDIDLDWFNNTGWKCDYPLRHETTLTEALTNADGLVNSLLEKHILLSSLTIATSPDYTFTELADDLLERLVEGLLHGYAAAYPEVLKGMPSYSLNTVILARSLFNFVYDNMRKDPRLAEYNECVETESAVYVFNSEIVNMGLPIEPERFYAVYGGLLNPGRAIPKPKMSFLGRFDNNRGSYSRFISLSDDYGLTVLKGSLEELQRLQLDENSRPEALEAAYTDVLYLLGPIVEFGERISILPELPSCL